MKTIRLVPALLLLALAALAPRSAWAADSISVRAILVIASNEPGKSDSRLAPYEATLRRILRFESYRFVGEDSGSSNLNLGDGHRIQISGEKGGATHRVTANWTHNGQSLMNTGMQLRPGVPAVIGGPSAGGKGEAYAVILIAQ